MFRKVVFKIDHCSVYHNGIFMILPACMCVCARARRKWRGGRRVERHECYTEFYEAMCDDA